MTDMLRRAIAASLALALALASLPSAGADSPEVRSRKLFKDATELANRGQYAEACPLFQEAHNLNSTGGTALRTADCYEKTGKYEEALSLYQYIVDHRATDSSPERVALAEGRVTALKKQLAPEPTVAAPSVTAAPTAAPTVPATSSVPAATGPVSSGAPVPLGPSAKPRGNGLMIASFVTGGAGLAIGAVFGGLALAKADAVKQACGPAPAYCPQEKKHADEATGLAWISNLGVTLAVAGAVTGIVLLATRPSPKAQQAAMRMIGPGGVTFRF